MGLTKNIIFGLVGSASAQTLFPTIVFSLINDQTGVSTQATVLADGTINHIIDLPGIAKLSRNGVIEASSAQLVDFVPNLFCVFKKADRDNVVVINDKRTFVLFNQEERNGLAVLNDVTIQCEI